MTDVFDCRAALPFDLDRVHDILAEIDIMWIERGAGRLHALFEVEHSTPVYSGLLRFNDVLLVSPQLGARFSIVSNNKRRSLFIIIGTNDNQLSKVMDIPKAEVTGLHKIIIDLAQPLGFSHIRTLARQISGIANTMRNEYIVILAKN